MWSTSLPSLSFLYTSFQYNICTCGAELSMILTNIKRKFQYNICTCGAVFLVIKDYIKQNFNTTFVHVEPNPLISILTNPPQFQYNICTCGAIAVKLIITCIGYFNTTFVHVERSSPSFRPVGYSISIQHLYMWSSLYKTVNIILTR